MKHLHKKSLKPVSGAKRILLDAESISLMRLVNALRFPEVEVAAKRILANRPQNPLALKALGFSLSGMGRYDEALPIVKHSLERNPNDPELLNNLGIILSSLMRWRESITCFTRSLEIKQDDPEVLKNFGTALSKMHRWNEAVPYFLKAIEYYPGDYVEAVKELSGTLLCSNRVDEAWTCVNELWKGDKNNTAFLSQLIYASLKKCDWQDLEARLTLLRSLTADFQSLFEHPFVLLAYPGVSPEEQKQVAGQYVKGNIPLRVLDASDSEWPIRGVSQQEKNRLRIGYLSSDFKNHPVGLIIPEVIELHNRADFEVFGYSFGFDDHSDVRQRLEKSFDHFADLAEASVGETAHRIRNDRIDILIDLNGWTMDGRPEALALRCAPIQVNWLGYAGTMGHGKLADYLLGDPVVTPLIAEGAYAETLAQLPDCYLPVDTTIDPGMPPTRRNAGLPDTGFVFCSFNNSYKFNPYVFDTWCRLLREAPDSCLWLSLPGQSAQDNLRKEAAARGVDPGRIFFAPFVATKQEHLARIQLADLALDTFPYNSHSSGVDTLWAGVPMVALLGETFPGRVGASLLRAAGLDEMVTVSIDQYHDLALEMYQNPQRLRDVRAKLAQAKKQSPLFDMPAFVRGLERVYLRMQNDRLTGIRAPII